MTSEQRVPRQARIERATAETNITLELVLDGGGRADIETGIGFFDHMLGALARHGLFDLSLRARGDLEVEAHHTVEDVGLCLGRAFRQAVGDKQGIYRFGSATVPMDDALVRVTVDLSGRPYLGWRLELPARELGSFHSELTREFFQAWANEAGANLHVDGLAGFNTHHLIEAAFKAFARALDAATETDPRVKGVPSTKGTL